MRQKCELANLAKGYEYCQINAKTLSMFPAKKYLRAILCCLIVPICHSVWGPRWIPITFLQVYWATGHHAPRIPKHWAKMWCDRNFILFVLVYCARLPCTTALLSWRWVEWCQGRSGAWVNNNQTFFASLSAWVWWPLLGDRCHQIEIVLTFHGQKGAIFFKILVGSP